jgi:hypothetical protein
MLRLFCGEDGVVAICRRRVELCWKVQGLSVWWGVWTIVPAAKSAGLHHSLCVTVCAPQGIKPLERKVKEKKIGKGRREHGDSVLALKAELSVQHNRLHQLQGYTSYKVTVTGYKVQGYISPTR